MKTIITFLLMIVTSSLNYSQSSIVFDAGTDIEVGTGADVSAGTITVNGTHSGGGTFNNGPLPVELVSFNAIIVKDKVELKWQTSTEVNNYGFEVERKAGSLQSAVSSNPESFRKISSNQFEKIGFVHGQGNSNSPKEYSFVDDAVFSGKYFYRLKQIDNDGKYEYSEAIEADLGTPKEFNLSQNYPNPFNPMTTIKFALPEASKVNLKVYSVMGEEVVELVNEEKPAGFHQVEFSARGGSAPGGNASKLSSGIYFYEINAGKFRSIKKMLLIK